MFNCHLTFTKSIFVEYCHFYLSLKYFVMFSTNSPIKKDMNVPIETNKLSISTNDSMKIENEYVKLQYI